MHYFTGWRLLIFGFGFLVSGCQSRAVNISNTWTLPQEGFSVFYRFFRDKISWFEADAVCQFHHANLVTVANGVQFDAARAFLKELDVTEFVWIGLMRPQNTDYFVWTNSKPLDSTSGYWADPFPVMESPLCAVIDPVRDFRWHALRCGGPETAAFLCEMEVPNWASECAIRAMPSLTVQYMSDSGTVELSRDCGEEGTRHMSCRGKEDREAILNELTCVDEIDTTDNTLRASETELSEVHQKSVAMIKKIMTDNNEDNNIDVNVNKIDVINTKDSINMDDMMMGDQPSVSVDEIHAFITDVKPTKKSKKVDELSLKKNGKKKTIKTDRNDEELMLGDQPIEEQPKRPVVEEILPHSKKSLAQDLKHKLETEAKIVLPVEAVSKKPSIDKKIVVTPTPTSTPVSLLGVTEPRLRRETEISSTESVEIDTVSTESSIITTDSVSNIAHLTKISKKSNIPQPRHDLDLIVGPLHLANGEADSNNDHFIPPMLLVRTKFTSTKSHLDNTISEESSIEPYTASVAHKEVKLLIESHPTIQSSTETASNIPTTTLTPVSTSTEHGTTTETISSSSSVTITHPTILPKEFVTSTSSAPSTSASSTTLNTVSVESTTKPNTDDITNAAIVERITSEGLRPSTPAISTFSGTSFRQPHAPKHSAMSNTTPSPPTSTESISVDSTTPLSIDDKIIEIRIDDATTLEPILVTTKASNEDIEPVDKVKQNISVSTETEAPTSTTILPALVANITTTIAPPATSTNTIQETADQSEQDPIEVSSTLIALSADDQSMAIDANLNQSDFTNAENYQPYRPNRRRSLTKPEIHTYIKKILG